MKIILLITIGLSILNADFVKSAESVSDTTSKLEWQDNEIGESTTWQSAIERCENLDLAGHSDWRLPNINELKSIVDRSKSSPAIVSAFEQTSSSGYWSSTTFEDYKYNAWGVNFYNGGVGYDYKDSNYYVRCVRAGQ